MKVDEVNIVVNEIKVSLLYAPDEKALELVNALFWTAQRIEYRTLIPIIAMLIDDLPLEKKILFNIRMKFNSDPKKVIKIFHDILIEIIK